MSEEKKEYMVTLDLTPMIGEVLEDMQAKVRKETGKKPSKSALIRQAVAGHYALDLYREPDRILAIYEAQYIEPGKPKVQKPESQAPKRKAGRKATEADYKLRDAYRETYSVVSKQVFWPPILDNVADALDGGVSYADLEKCIRVSPQVPIIKDQIDKNNGMPLSMHVLMSKKNLGHLVEFSASAVPLVENKKLTDELIKRRDAHLRDIRHNLGSDVAGEFYRKSATVTSKNEMDALRQQLYATHGVLKEQTSASE